MPSSDPLHQLRDLDRTPEFSNRLIRLINGLEYKNRIASLQRDDSALLIEYLDNALDTLQPATPAFRKCLRELESICGTWKKVPQSCLFNHTLPTTAQWPVGSKGSCDVYEGFVGNLKFSVKRLRIYSDDKQQKAKHAFCQEAVLWKRLDHPNIVPLLGVTDSPCQFISTRMAGGELSEYINAHPQVGRLSLLSDVADGLNYLHSYGIIHGDLKGPSVLVDDTGRARITDFGLAMVFMNSGAGEFIKDGHALRWAAPEILEKRMPVSIRSDVFSFSMVVIEAFTGRPPFDGIAPTTAGVGVLLGRRPARPVHADLTNELWNMMNRCWDQDPQLRPGISEVVLCVRNAIDPQDDSTDVGDDQITDNVTSESVRPGDFMICSRPRPPRWTLTSCVPQRLCKFGKFSPAPRLAPDADGAQYASLEDEKRLAKRRQSTSTLSFPQRARFWLSACNPFRLLQKTFKRNRAEASTTRDCAYSNYSNLNCAHDHPVSPKIF